METEQVVRKVASFSRPREAARAVCRTLRTWSSLGQLERKELEVTVEGSGKVFSGGNSLALLELTGT